MILSEYVEKIDNELNKDVIDRYIKGSEIYNRTFSNKSKVIYVKDKGIYIKISKLNSLKNEYENTLFFNQLGVAGEVIEYISDENNDYLMVKEIEGENGISDNHLKDPKKLATSFGEHLRMLHSLKFDICPKNNRVKSLVNECNKNVREDKIDMDLFFKNYGFTPNQGLLMLDSLKTYSVDDVFIHGDYYLPNIIMDDFKFRGIVDMSLSGLGDRHFDIVSGIKSLEIVFKTKEYNNIFLDAYGTDRIDKDRLAFAKLLLILS